MAERGEDIDYEPDVLKFKQIWDEMKETNKDKTPKNNHNNSQNHPPKSKDKCTSKNQDKTQQNKK